MNNCVSLYGRLWSLRPAPTATDHDCNGCETIQAHRYSPYEKAEIKADEQALRGNSMERQV